MVFPNQSNRVDNNCSSGNSAGQIQPPVEPGGWRSADFMAGEKQSRLAGRTACGVLALLKIWNSRIWAGASAGANGIRITRHVASIVGSNTGNEGEANLTPKRLLTEAPVPDRIANSSTPSKGWGKLRGRLKKTPLNAVMLEICRLAIP